MSSDGARAATPIPSSSDQDMATGRFKPGNKANKKGNPTTHAARLRGAMMSAVTTTDIRAIVAEAVRLAKGGDISCIRLILSNAVGRPPAAEMSKEFQQLRDDQKELAKMVDELIRSKAS